MPEKTGAKPVKYATFPQTRDNQHQTEQQDQSMKIQIAKILWTGRTEKAGCWKIEMKNQAAYFGYRRLLYKRYGKDARKRSKTEKNAVFQKNDKFFQSILDNQQKSR